MFKLLDVMLKLFSAQILYTSDSLEFYKHWRWSNHTVHLCVFSTFKQLLACIIHILSSNVMPRSHIHMDHLAGPASD